MYDMYDVYDVYDSYLVRDARTGGKIDGEHCVSRDKQLAISQLNVCTYICTYVHGISPT